MRFHQNRYIFVPENHITNVISVFMKSSLKLFIVHYLVFTILFLSGLKLFSQNFNGGIIGGLTATQISGDRLVGYNKLGLNAGAFVNLQTNKYISWEMELKFIQKGSKSQFGIFDTSVTQRKIYRLRLNYIEMPFLFKYDMKGLSKYASDSSYHLINKLTFEAGIAYALLLSSMEEDATGNYTLYTPTFNKGDLSLMAGLYYAISDNVKVNIRYSGSILPVRAYHTNPSPLPYQPGFGLGQRLNKGQKNDVLELTLHIQFNKHKGQ